MSSRSISWMSFPKKKVFSIEYSGEPAYGKTHNIFTYPSVAVADTVGEGDAWLIAEKFGNSMVFKAKNFEDLELFVDYCVKNPKIESIGIDSGSDVLEMAEQKWLKDHHRDSVYVVGQGAFQWAQVYNMVDDLVQRIRSSDKYFVTTSRLKDEWLGEGEKASKTGERVRDSYKKFPFGLSVMIQLEDGLPKDETTRIFQGHIFGKVLKNRFLHRRVQKPYIFDPTYQGLVEEKELTTPWCGNFDEKTCDLKICARCPKFKEKSLVDEAKKYLIGIGEIKESAIEAKKQG